MATNFFELVNDKFFSPFTSQNKQLNYDLLHLINSKMHNEMKLFPRNEVMSWLEEYLENCPFVFIDDESGEDEGHDIKLIASNKLRYFVSCGWLIDENDNKTLKTTYQMDSNAILILNVMEEIVNNDTKPMEYTGYVYSIYSSLQRFDFNHATDIVQQMRTNTQDLMDRLRGLNVHIKKYLKTLLADDKLNINVGKELSLLRKKYNRPAPVFFKEIDVKQKENQYEFYDTAMDYIYQAVRAFNFQKCKNKKVRYMPISWMVGGKTTSDNATDYRHRDKIIEICEEYRTIINRLYMELRSADDQEREVIYDRISDEKVERDKKVSKWLTSENVLIFVIRHYEKNRPSDWRIYAPIVNAPRFKELMLKSISPEFHVEEDENGRFTLYGKKFAIKR